MKNRVLTAARLNTVGAVLRLGMPWAIVGVALLINIVIFALVRANVTDGETGVTGALTALYVFIFVAYLQTMTQSFPFALSLGVTRRNFYLGAGLTVLAETLLHAVLLTVLLAIERATGGWGVDVSFFGVGFLMQPNPLLQFFAYWAPMVAMGFLGVVAGTVFKRWGQYGLYVAGIASLLVFGGLAILVSWQQWWPAVGEFFTSTPELVLIGLYPLVLAAVAAGGGFLLLRRATP